MPLFFNLTLDWLYSPLSFWRNCKEVHQFADYHVNLALTRELSPDSENGVEEGLKKGSCIFLQELVKITRDRNELHSQLLNILLAGRDTTAGLLGWTFYLLTRHPNIFTRLREVILDEFSPFSNTTAISFESLKS
jgi:hypothetical protein